MVHQDCDIRLVGNGSRQRGFLGDEDMAGRVGTGHRYDPFG